MSKQTPPDAPDSKPGSSPSRDTEELRDFLDHALDGMHWVAGDGTILWANAAELELLGYTAAEYIGHHIAEFHVDRPVIDDLLARLWRNETLHHYEARMRCKDGSIRHVQINTSVLWRDGKFVHTRCVTRDITQQKCVEAERERLLRQLTLERSVIGILAERRPFPTVTADVLRTMVESGSWTVGAFWLVDDGNRSLRCVDFWCAPGTKVATFEGGTRDTSFGAGVGLPGRIWQSNAPCWIEHLADDDNFPRFPIAQQIGLQSAIGVPVRARGRVVGVLEFFSEDARPRDEDIVHLFESVAVQIGHFVERRDIDEVRDRLAAIVDSSDDAIVSKTLDGVITSWNRGAEAMFGYAADEVIGRSIYLIVPPDRHHEEENVLARLRRGEKIDHYETERLARDGRRLNISLTVSPVRDADGRIVGASKVARDVTAQRRAIQEIDSARRAAEAANRTKDEFLAMLGHELRNPLAPILTALQLMQLRGDDATVKERAVIDRQVRHLVRLVDDLLDVSRIARGKIVLKEEPIELAEVVARAIEIASPLLEERQHHLTLSVSRTGLLIRGDATRLAQAVMNVLTNAAKYTPVAGHIDVRAFRQGDEVVLSVKDDGVGISTSLLPNVFDLFVQESQNVDRSRGGLGLGLTIVRNLVQLHGGSVEAHSDGPGTGSEFLIRLPALVPSGAHAVPKSEPVLGPRRRPLSVLVVDDNADAAAMIAHALAARGDVTRVALDGPSALAIAAQFHADVALLDLGLPVMDGYELAGHLRLATTYRPPILVAISGYGQETDRERSRAAGFNAHLVKPVDLTVLNTLLDHIAAGEAKLT